MFKIIRDSHFRGNDNPVIITFYTVSIPSGKTGVYSNRLANSRECGYSGSVIFDGKDDSGEALRIGIYIIFLEALNESAGVVENLRTDVVVKRELRR
jgi:hypothetical protein